MPADLDPVNRPVAVIVALVWVLAGVAALVAAYAYGGWVAVPGAVLALWLASSVRAHYVAATIPRIVSTAIALAVLAWLSLLIGLIFAGFAVTDAPPSPIILVPSSKGLTRLLVELVSFGTGGLGLLLVVVAFFVVARNRVLAFAAVANASVCALCVALQY